MYVDRAISVSNLFLLSSFIGSSSIDTDETETLNTMVPNGDFQNRMYWYGCDADCPKGAKHSKAEGPLTVLNTKRCWPYMNHLVSKLSNVSTDVARAFIDTNPDFFRTGDMFNKQPARKPINMTDGEIREEMVKHLISRCDIAEAAFPASVSVVGFGAYHDLFMQLHGRIDRAAKITLYPKTSVVFQSAGRFATVCENESNWDDSLQSFTQSAPGMFIDTVNGKNTVTCLFKRDGETSGEEHVVTLEHKSNNGAAYNEATAQTDAHAIGMLSGKSPWNPNHGEIIIHREDLETLQADNYKYCHMGFLDILDDNDYNEITNGFKSSCPFCNSETMGLCKTSLQMQGKTNNTSSSSSSSSSSSNQSYPGHYSIKQKRLLLEKASEKWDSLFGTIVGYEEVEE